jgi:hypothetical protein
MTSPGHSGLSGIPGVDAEGRVDAVERRSVADLRALRGVLQSSEDEQSLRRRLVQGRLDIVRAEQQRRLLGGATGLSEVLADLPVTLAGPPASSPRTRPPRAGPGRPRPTVGDELESVCGINELRRLPDLAADDLRDLEAGLVVLERATSELRGALHRALDAVSAELAHRYATGEASVDDLLGPGTGLGPAPATS